MSENSKRLDDWRLSEHSPSNPDQPKVPLAHPVEHGAAPETALDASPKGVVLDPVPWSFRETLTGSLLTMAAFLIPSALFLLIAVRRPVRVIGSQVTPGSISLHVLLVAILLFALTGLAEAGFTIAPLLAAFRKKRGGWRALALRPPLNWARAVQLIIWLLVFSYILDGLYALVVQQVHLAVETNAVEIIRSLKKSPATVWGLLAASIVVAPFAEELFFRGYLFRGLRLKIGTVWAALLSAVVFALAHLSPGTFVPLFILGLLLALLVARTHSLWPAILLHTLNNALTTIAVVVAVYGSK